MDIASSVPSVFDIIGAASVGGAEDSTATEGDSAPNSVAMLRITRTAKLGKFLKVVRILKILRIAKLGKAMQSPSVQQVRDTISIALIEHTRKVRISKILIFAIVVAHLLSCMLGISTMFADQKLESWWGPAGFCWPDDVVGQLADGRDKARCVGPWQQYFTCMHYTLGCIFGLDGDMFLAKGPGVKHFAFADEGLHEQFQHHEQMLFFVVQFASSLLGLYITGAFVSVVTGEQLSVSEEVSLFCKRYEVSAKQRRELQTYFMTLASLHDSVPKPDLFVKLSPKLQEQLLMETHKAWVTALPFFDVLRVHMNGLPCSDEMVENGEHLLAKMALSMKPGLYIARERARPRALYVIVKGIMIEIYSKHIVKHGQSTGSLGVLLGYKDANKYTSLSVTQYVCLEQEALIALVAENPEQLAKPFGRLKVWGRYKILQRNCHRLVDQARALGRRRSSLQEPALAHLTPMEA